MTIRAELADGRVLEFPDGTDPNVIQSTVKRVIAGPSVQQDFSQMSTEQLEAAPSAPTSISDIARSLGIGVVGGVKSIADVFGAGSDVSEYLGETASGLQKGMTPARQQEIARRQELERRAAESGDTFKEIKSFLGGVAEAPIQSLVQGVGSSAPTILASLAAIPAGAPASLALGVGLMSKYALGAAQGVGELKGSILDEVEQAYIKAGYDKEQARELALKAQEYSQDKALQMGGAALLGAFDAFTGIESSVSKAARRTAAKKLAGEAVGSELENLPEKALTRPTVIGSAARSALGEAPLEGAQGGYGEYAKNLALIQEGLLDPQLAMQGVFGAAARDAAVGALTGTAFTPVERANRMREYELDQSLRQQKEQEEARQLAVSDEELAQRFPETLPGGFKIETEELGRETVPVGFNIMAEGRDQPLAVVDTAEEAQAKLESLTQIREQERENLLKEEQKINTEVEKAQARLEQLEATEQADTDEYKSLKAELPNMMEQRAEKIQTLYDKVESLGKPLTAMPFGETERVNQQFTVLSPESKPIGSFKTMGEAEAAIKSVVGEEKYQQIQQNQETAKNLYKTFVPQMRKFGLGDVGLNIVERIENGAGGAYLNKLIKVALDEPAPVQTMRHESLHAMKDLGFFTPQQWKALEERANKEWIKTYLEGQETEIDGQKMSRLEGYKKLGYTEQDIVEEAIADAFGAYDKGQKPPPGLIQALFKRIKNFFTNLNQALRGAGFQSAEDIFGQIEAGKLKPAAQAKATEKFSLPIMRGEEKPKFQEEPKEGETEGKKIKPTVDLIAAYFDKKVKEEFGDKLSYGDKAAFDRAVKTATDEVNYQLQQEKSGLDWYEDDVKEAFKQTKKFIPELGKTDNRLLFSVIAGIMSPQTTARDNWFIAAKAFEHYLKTKDIPGNNPETGGLWQGGTQSPNKKIQLEFLDRMVKDMGQKKALEWLFQDHTVKEINQFRQKYGNMKSGIDGKLTDMKPGLYAFGPKVGPFVSNLNGIHDVTVDKWMTRTFNRYFGTMLGPDGKIVDAPTEPQRRAIKALVNEVAKNAGIKPYQVQSLLWFYEQRLFTEIGVPSASYGFSDGGKKYAESRGRGGEAGVSPTAKTTARPVKGEKRETTRPEQPVERPGPRGGKEPPKYSLRSDIRSYIGGNEAASGSYKRRSVDDSGSIRVLGVKPVARYEPIDSLKKLVGRYGFESPAFYELGGKNAKTYQEAIQKAKDASPYGAAVYVYPVEDYANMRLFLTEDGKAGFALKGDDIVSVFSGPPHKGSANSSLQLAVQEGGRRLDAFDTVLPELYNVNGFQIVGRMKWNEDYKPDGWDKKTFSPFNGGEPDVVYMAYDPSDNRTVAENQGEYFDDPDELSQAQQEAVKKYRKPVGGIVLGTKQPDAISVNGSHYGNVKTDTLDASKYGTGLRGAERRRLDEPGVDPRIKKRVYFYAQKEDGTTPIPEAGVGQYVYTQKFDNILAPGAEMSRLFREANGDSNGFESNVVDAGYDGYVVPSMGMMVILNHNVPVNYVGPRAEVGVQKLSLKGVSFPSVKEAKKAVEETKDPDTKEFKQFIGASQWRNEDGSPKRFYHATAAEFFEFTPAGQSQAIFLADTPEEAETFGSIAEDRLRRQIYRALNKDDKLPFFQGIIDKAVADGKITQKQGEDFIKQAKRKMPEYGDFGDIEQETYDALLDLSPNRMRIMPLYARAETPFEFDNPDHVNAVMNWVANNTEYPQDFPEKWLNGLKGRISQGLWQAIEDKRVQAAIRALGHDGFTVRENRASPKNYAVYTPQQVKSITGNLGDFSLESKDVRYSLKNVRYGDERFESLLNSSTYTNTGEEKTATKYLAFIDPADFARATSSMEKYFDLKKELEPLDFSKMKKLGAINLQVEIDKNGDWKIKGHEGRHRMLALNDAGYRDVPVVLDFGKPIKNTEPISGKWLKGQEADSMNQWTLVTDIEPLSIDNTERARSKFTRLDSKPTKYSLPSISTADKDRMREVVQQRYEPTWKDRVIGTFKQDFTSVRQKLLNRYEQLAVYDRALREKIRQAGGPELLADQSAESAALFSDLGAGITASAMGVGDRQGGIPVYRNGVTTIDPKVKGLVAALAPLAKYGDPEIYERYQFWAGWKRGRRLLAEGRERNYTPADAAVAQRFEAAHPEFVQVQKDLTAFNDGIVKYLVDTGVISKERGQVYTQYADYIPFYRQFDLDKTIGPNPFSGISGVKGPKQLKGGESPIGDFMENLVRNTQSAINAGLKNTAAQRATDVAMRLNGPGNVYIERLARPTAGVGYDVYTVLEKGELVYYRSADPLFIDALKSLNMPDLPFMGLLSAPANALRNLVTKDPGFMMANLLRDSLSSYVTSGQNVTPIVGTMVNFGKALTGKNPGLDALFNSGIIGGYEFSQNIEQSGKSLERDLEKKAGKGNIVFKPFKSLWDALEKGTTASDAATRIAVYERVMKETGNEAEALFRALEVMNFNRKGNSPVIRIATAAIPFFNARLQGLDLFYRASTGKMDLANAKEIQKKFWVRGATMAALSVMYYFSVAGDDEYEDQEQETKDNNWLFPGLGIRIPIPFEVGILFKTMPERITAYAFGNDTGKDLADSIKRSLIGTFGFNPIPQTFKPLVEVATNYNFFTMRPIVGQGLAEVAPEFQVGPGTSRVAEKLGAATGLSPMKIDQLIKGYTGTIGGYVTDLVDTMLDLNNDSPKAAKRLEQMPVIKRFMLDPEARGPVTQFYELQKAVDTTVRTMNLLERTARPEEFAQFVQDNLGPLAVKDYVRDLEKSMKDLREMKQAIQTASMSGQDKQEALTAIGQAEKNLTRNIQSVKKAISELK